MEPNPDFLRVRFITEDGLRFIKDLGSTVVRVPFNYRHFESDDQPFEYKPEGVRR